VLLIHQLPPRPTNLRVRIWRQLHKLGAVAIKNSVYVLPAGEKTYEDFQWLKQQIESASGEAVVLQAASVGGTTDAEIIEAFRKARDEEFSVIAGELEGLARTIRGHGRGESLSAGRVASYEAELNRLHAELEHIIGNDFFHAPGRQAALDAYQGGARLMRTSRTVSSKASRSGIKKGSFDLTEYQGRRWVTRRNLHIDRLASAWLIRQFIDKRPRFYFVADGETIEGAIPFDMYSAVFTHHGEDCTFETMLKQFGLNNNRALNEMGQIVHDIDLKDDKFHRLEAAGLNTIISGLSQTLRDDRKLMRQTSIIFDSVYTALGNTTLEKQSKPRRRMSKRRGKARSSVRK
jgi:hypothetical protein